MELISLFPFDPELGYLGLGLLSFFGSLVPFIPVPSFILLATMSIGDTFNLHVLAITSSLAATAAKQIVFYVSYGSRKIINKKIQERMKPFQRLVKRYGGAAAFVAAATPIPDDMVYVPLGLAKYNPLRFFVATLAGKLILHYVIVVASHYLGLSLLESYLDETTNMTDIYLGVVVFGIAIAVVVVLMLRLDWARILGKAAPWTLDDSED